LSSCGVIFGDSTDMSFVKAVHFRDRVGLSLVMSKFKSCEIYTMFQKEFYNFESLYKFI
jgi:hypothetical protein